MTQRSLVEVHKNFTSTYVNENSSPYIYIRRRNSHEQMFLKSGYECNSRRPALQPRKPIHSFSPQRSKEFQSPTVVFLGSHPPSSCAGVFGGLNTSILICVNPPKSLVLTLAYVESTRQSASQDHTTNLGALHSTRCSRDRESQIPANRRSKG